jgi:hypothetical protein
VEEALKEVVEDLHERQGEADAVVDWATEQLASLAAERD